MSHVFIKFREESHEIMGVEHLIKYGEKFGNRNTSWRILTNDMYVIDGEQEKFLRENKVPFIVERKYE